MTQTQHPARSASPVPTRSAAVATSLVALLLGGLEIAAGAYFWYATSIDTSDDPLVSLGYVAALLVGAPGVVGVVLAGLGWLLADRVAGLVLAILGAVAVAFPALLVLFFVSPTF